MDAVCAAALTVAGGDDTERLLAWLRRFFNYVSSKRAVAVELLEHADRSDAVFGASRQRVVTAGEPLLRAARQAGQVQTPLSLDQILDMIVAVAKIPADPAYLGPILETVLAGLRHGATETA